MAKPVCGVCNLDCRYCYYLSKPRELYPDVKQFMMSDEVLDSYVRQYMEALPVHCDFGWQGGEPLLAGREFFKRAVALQKQYGRSGQVVANALQTNGTLLDEAWCDLLAEHKFLVGISLDGPPQWHDAFRRDGAGNATFHRAWAGLELLAKRGVEFNVLVTLNSANAPHAGDIYRYFVNRGVRYVQFIPVLERNADGTATDYSCTAAQFGAFMSEVFAIWSARDVGRVSERLIDNVLHQMIFNSPAMCCHAQRCANAQVLEFNGDVYVCDHFVYKRWRVGNILHRPLVELVNDPMLDEFARMKSELPSRCVGCEYVEFCQGGCPKHHMPIGNDPARVNHFCEGYKRFFGDALPELRRMAEYFRNGQTPPMRQPAGAVAPAPTSAQFAAGPAPLGPRPARAAPGRNDPCPCGSGRKFKGCCGKR